MEIFIFVIFAIVFLYVGIKIREEENIRNEANKRKSIIETEEKKKLKKERITRAKECLSKIIKEQVFKHRFALVQEKRKLTETDIYGNIDSSKWKNKYDPSSGNTGLTDFYIKVIHKEIDVLTQKELGKTIPYSSFFKELDQEIDLISKNLSLANETNSMSGVEYEKHCKEILEQAGWEVEETPATNDQGVDLIACIEDLRVCIQCKCFAKAVGNKAVQEIIAGTKYRNGTHSVVVAKSGFTTLAKQLAESANVILTSDIELAELENRVL